MCSAAQVWALVSGLSSPQKERRLMMVLQAFIDDSGEQDDKTNPVFVLAGFLADSERWAQFAAEWRAALDAEPSISYFKMKEADRLDGEFDRNRGWTTAARDEKLGVLIPIIKKHVNMRLAVSIDKAAYARHIRSIPAPNRTSILDKPYFLAFHHVVLGTAAQYLMRGVVNPCDFIFDEQGSIGNDVLDVWDNLKEIADDLAKNGRTDFRPFLGSKPIFRDDKSFLPLQAADFYAWQVRRLFYENKVLTVPHRPELRAVEIIPAMTWHVDENQMRDMRLNLLRSGAYYIAENPNAKLKEYQGTKAAQRRARVAKRASRVKRRLS